MGGGDAGGVKELADRHHDARVVVSGVARKFPREAEDGQIERECGIMGDVQRQHVTPFLGKLLLERPGKSVLQGSAVSTAAGDLLRLLFALEGLRRKVAVRRLRGAIAGEHHELSNLRSFVFRNDIRSEERRVGKECGSTFRSRWSQYHTKK